MMNRNVAQVRHDEWQRASSRNSETNLGERTDRQLKRSGKVVHRLRWDVVEGHDVRDSTPWRSLGS
jgi:hypothetical protein